MNIIEAMDLLYKDRKIYNTLWKEKRKYIYLNDDSELVDQDGIEVEASEILITHNWEEYNLITEQEKTILKNLITLSSFEKIGWIAINKTVPGCPNMRVIHIYNAVTDEYAHYSYFNMNLFKHIVSSKKYTLKELEIC